MPTEVNDQTDWPPSAGDVYGGSAGLGRVTVFPGVPGETPTDLKSLARDDAGRDGVQSRHSEQRAVLGALHRPQSEALAVDLRLPRR